MKTLNPYRPPGLDAVSGSILVQNTQVKLNVYFYEVLYMNIIMFKMHSFLNEYWPKYWTCIAANSDP